MTHQFILGVMVGWLGACVPAALYLALTLVISGGAKAVPSNKDPRHERARSNHT